ncbi:lytic transglycosylase domain-containing protein [Candidatus Woesearchaeota archaeon]|nr:lytic transglycosylase domain-containing protein [Candidatus Woesearchaeota archaeon]
MVKRSMVWGFLSFLVGISASTAYIAHQRKQVPTVQDVVDKIETMTTYCPRAPNESQYDVFLEDASKEYNLDWRFAKAILIKESHFQEDLISSTGAVGPMQLMPRSGSYTTENYIFYVKARASKERTYNGKTTEEWAALYKQDLEILIEEGLKEKDTRFDPAWNINEGVRQLAGEHQFFLSETENPYYAKIFAAAAYNAGRTAVLRGTTHIPVNKQTEYYAPEVLQIYDALVEGNGRLRWEDCWLLKL